MSNYSGIRRLLEDTVARGESAKLALAKLDRLEKSEAVRRRQRRGGA